jgi:hypothetical protein
MSSFRPGMDVYTADQKQYIGTVTRVLWRPAEKTPGAGPVETGSSESAVQGNPELVHEQQAQESPTAHLAERRLGEEMGPVPTIALGNSGPEEQSAGRHYATEPRGPKREAEYLVVRPGRINLGILTPPLWVPAGAVRSVSLERVVLDVERDGVPISWRVPPALSSLR